MMNRTRLMLFLISMAAWGGNTKRIEQVSTYFEPNRGQFDQRVELIGRAGSELFCFEDNGDVRTTRGVTLRLRGDRVARGHWAGSVTRAGRSNYFLGSDPTKWQTNVPQFSRAFRRDVYPGIDVVYYDGGPNRIEYDFVIAAGADPEQIEIGLEGVPLVRTNADGDILCGGFLHKAPLAYQERGGRRVPIKVGYRVKGNSIRFVLGRYDKRRPLVIDPVLLWAASVGPTTDRTITTNLAAFTADPAGNVYLAGSTNLAAPYPTSTISEFVMKLDSSGQNVVYVTYLGGSQGATIGAIAVDAAGSAVLAGDTSSSDFPLIHAAVPDFTPFPFIYMGFLTKLSPNGDSLEFSTYVKDLFVENSSQGAVAASAGGIFAKGGNSLTKFASSGALKWSNAMHAALLAVGPEGNPVTASSTHQPPGGSGSPLNVLLQKWNGDDGALVVSTVFGGEGYDLATQLAVSSSGSIYLAGNTTSLQLPVISQAAQPALNGGMNGFLAIHTSDLSALTGMSYFGGNGAENIGGLSIAPNGDALLSGETTSSDLLLTDALSNVVTWAPGSFPQSGDGGSTWSYATRTPFWSINSLAVSSTNLLALGRDYAGDTRLFRSTDRGQNWSSLPVPLFPPFVYVTRYAKLVQSAADPLRVYLYEPLALYILVSSDGGLNWTKLVSPTNHNPFPRGDLTPNPYVTNGLFGYGGGLYYSVNGGMTFGLLAAPADGFGSGLAVDPNNPNSVFLTCGVAGVYRTADGGVTWAQVLTGNCNSMDSSLAAPQVLIANTYPQGVFRSTDSGLTWSSVATILPFNARLSVSADGTAAYGFDGTSLFRSADGGLSWTELATPVGLQCADNSILRVDPEDGMTLYAPAAGQSNRFVASIAADTSSVKFSTYLGTGHCGQIPGPAFSVASDGAGNAILASTNPGFPATSGSVNQGQISVVKLSGSAEAVNAAGKRSR